MDIPRELAKLIRGSPNLRGLLDRAVSLIVERMGVDVCSIYLLDPADQRLWLVASHGFRPKSVGAVSLSLQEGLTGQVVNHLRGLAVADAPSHPSYRHFPETGEEGFHSYLGEPLSIGGRPVGSIVLRTRENREFTADERETLSAISSQLVGLVENARLLEALARPQDAGRAYLREVEQWHAPAPEPEDARQPGRTLHGAAISDGIAIAEAVQLGEGTKPEIIEGPVVPAQELERLERALTRARAELTAIEQFTRREVGADSALIFGSNLLMLSDDYLTRKLQAGIRAGASAAQTVERVFTETAALLEGSSDEYLRQRCEDLHELRRRLLAALSGSETQTLPVADRIAVIPELSASAVVELRARGAAGIVAGRGGATSHGALLARSFELPAIAGLPDAAREIATGDPLALDGTEGVVVIRPEPAVVRTIRRAMEDRRQSRSQLQELRDLESVTTDGHRVALLANVGLGADLRVAARVGAEGVGLFRTEMAFLLHDALPSRAEQVRIYARVFELLPDRPVVFRTLDLGGDKFMRGHQEKEANPFLGYRSIRISLDREEEFIEQVQAFQIASLGQRASIMLPLISRVGEVRRARDLVREAGERLTREGLAHNDAMPVGAMIEVPAAVELAPILAREVAFFSIGTNDLVQYALAVDRGNERVAHLGDPMHPAVLSLIQRTARAGREAGIPVSVCGEMAGDPFCALALVGLGVDSLSMNSISIPSVKEAVRGASHAELRDRAPELLSLCGPDEVRESWREALVQAVEPKPRTGGRTVR